MKEEIMKMEFEVANDKNSKDTIEIIIFVKNGEYSSKVRKV